MRHQDQTLETDPQVAAARAIATIAHRDQVDKMEQPYIDHPRRVTARLSDPHEVAAAWLHDVVEDCSITADELSAAGIHEEVVAAVVLLTRTDQNKGDGYYKAIRENPTALAVKLADIADNTDPSRTKELPREVRERLAEKYAHALTVLTADAATETVLPPHRTSARAATNNDHGITPPRAPPRSGSRRC